MIIFMSDQKRILTFIKQPAMLCDVSSEGLRGGPLTPQCLRMLVVGGILKLSITGNLFMVSGLSRSCTEISSWSSSLLFSY